MKTVERVLYNGWRGARNHSGYATWNVALWLNNDQGLYLAMREFVRNHEGRITGNVAEEFVLDLLPHGTPDFKGKGGARMYSQVHWPSIAGVLREER